MNDNSFQVCPHEPPGTCGHACRVCHLLCACP
jgi:hypothetical protein